METFAEYILNEENLVTKMIIVNKLQRLLREKKGMSLFFNNSILFKAEIARMFIDYGKIDIDRNKVLTACLLCNCKKIDGPQSIESLHSFAKAGSEFLETIGFDKEFCTICEQVNRYSKSEPRTPEGDILELVDQFGGMILDRPERAGFTPEEAIVQMENDNLRGKQNMYFDEFKHFVIKMQEVQI
jgi:hypothetical protein